MNSLKSGRITVELSSTGKTFFPSDGFTRVT
jgi:hypothetical protein